jgi:hypothetical protein
MSNTSLMMERSQWEIGIAPVADAFAGTVYTDIISMAAHNRIRFIVFWGVGTTGTSTLTVEACDDVAGSNVSAVAFRYRRLSAAAAAPGTITAAASTGFTTTAGSAQIYEVEVCAADLLASGYSFVRLKCVEVAASARLGGILAELAEPRFASPLATATA